MPLEIIGTTLPTCPHCEHDHSDSYRGLNLIMNTRGIRECEFCGKKFSIVMEIVYSTKVIS